MLPREKFHKHGIDSLSDTDLISILVGSGIKGKNFESISRSMLRIIRKDIREGKEISLEDLNSIIGVGSITAMRVLCGIELGRRTYGLHNKDSISIYNSSQAYDLLKGMSSLKQEHIIGLYLNARFELIEQKTIRIGGVDSSGLSPRDVIVHALEKNASFVVIAHNHPSGDSTPSNEDISLTKRLSKAMDIVGIKLLEHIVISNDGWKSVRFDI